MFRSQAQRIATVASRVLSKQAGVGYAPAWLRAFEQDLVGALERNDGILDTWRGNLLPIDTGSYLVYEPSNVLGDTIVFCVTRSGRQCVGRAANEGDARLLAEIYYRWCHRDEEVT